MTTMMAFIAGLFIGGNLAFVITCLIVYSSDDERRNHHD